MIWNRHTGVAGPVGGRGGEVHRRHQFTYYRWRKEVGGLKTGKAKRLKEFEKENERLRKAVSDLTLEKLTWREAAS